MAAVVWAAGCTTSLALNGTHNAQRAGATQPVGSSGDLNVHHDANRERLRTEQMQELLVPDQQQISAVPSSLGLDLQMHEAAK